MFIKNITVITFVARISLPLEMWRCPIGNLYMSLYILRYLAKGGSLFDSGGSITVASLGVTDGSARKRENLGSWFLISYLHFLLSDE